jgi:predicted aspartyl protease
MRQASQCASLTHYNSQMSQRVYELRKSRRLHFVRESSGEIAFAFKCVCLVTFILVGSATCALCQNTAVPELKSLYESHQWFALRDESKPVPLPPFYHGAVDAAFNDLPSAQKYLEAVITSSPHSSDAYEAHELLATLYFRNGLYREALAHLEFMMAEKPSAEDVRNMLPLFASFSGGGDQDLVTKRVSSITMQQGTEGFYLPFAINGKEGAYAFDTGANFSVMSDSEAARLGLNVQTVETHVDDSSGGKVGLRVAVAKDFEIGGLHLKNVAFAVLPDSQEPFKELPVGNRGLIGIPVLLAMKSFQWEPSGTFTLGQATKHRNIASSNLCFDESFPVTQASFQGKPLELTVDTGAQRTVLGPPFAKEFASLVKNSGANEKHTLTGVAGSSSYDSVLLPSLTMSVGGHDVTLSPAHVLTKESSDTSSWAAGNLGIDLLNQAHSIAFDFGAMTMELQ